jgi:hypothetical protein
MGSGCRLGPEAQRAAGSAWSSTFRGQRTRRFAIMALVSPLHPGPRRFRADGDLVEQLTRGQADAPGRRTRVRPDGGGRAGGRRDAAHHQRVPDRRGAGGSVGAQPGPEEGRPAGHVFAPPRNGVRARPRVRVRPARPERRTVPLRSEVRLRALPGFTQKAPAPNRLAAVDPGFCNRPSAKALRSEA